MRPWHTVRLKPGCDAAQVQRHLEQMELDGLIDLRWGDEPDTWQIRPHQHRTESVRLPEPEERPVPDHLRRRDGRRRDAVVTGFTWRLLVQELEAIVSDLPELAVLQERYPDVPEVALGAFKLESDLSMYAALVRQARAQQLVRPMPNPQALGVSKPPLRRRRVAEIMAGPGPRRQRMKSA